MLQFKANANVERKRVEFTVSKILLVLLYAILLQAVIVILIGAVLGSNSVFMKTSAGKLMINFITALTVIIATGVVYRTNDIFSELFKQKLSLKVLFSGIKWGLVAFLAGWLTNWLSYTIYSHFALEIKPQQATLMLDNLPKSLLFPAIISVAVIAPIFEELVFRGLLQNTISHYTKPILGILVSGVLFALTHLDVYQLPGLFVLAICFSLTYKRSKTLYTPIIAHIVNNLIFLVCFMLIT